MDLIPTTMEAKKPRTWQLWERSENPPGFQMQPRDLQILRVVFLHRFLQPAHIYTLFPDGSQINLSRRLHLLWQHGYLERPRAIRPTKILTEQIVYALSNKGARLLQHRYPKLRIAHLDWNETPKKQVGFPYIDHQLAVATVMVCLEKACEARGIQLHWHGHYFRRRWLVETVSQNDVHTIIPDAYFTLEVPGKGIAHHFLELDRSSASKAPARMWEKCDHYFTFWKNGIAQRDFKHFRVLIVARDPESAQSLRRAAEPVGRDAQHPSTWKALMFSSIEAFNLEHPEHSLDPLWRYADSGQPVSLL